MYCINLEGLDRGKIVPLFESEAACSVGESTATTIYGNNVRMAANIAEEVVLSKQ